MPNDTLRGELWDTLHAKVSELGENIWEPSAATAKPELPMAVIQQAPEVPHIDKYAGVLHTFNIYPVVERGSFQSLDRLSRKVIDALGDTIIYREGIPHYVEYDGSDAEDVIVEDWEGLTRTLRFRIHELDWLDHLAVDPDPVDTMVRWTDKHTNHQQNPQEWTPTSERSALYWRRGETLETLSMAWGAWYTVVLHGHLINPDNKVRKYEVERLIEKLANYHRITMSDGSYMHVERLSADLGYDSFGQGQITLQVRYGWLEKTEYAPMRRVYINDDDMAKGVMDDD